MFKKLANGNDILTKKVKLTYYGCPINNTVDKEVFFISRPTFSEKKKKNQGYHTGPLGSHRVYALRVALNVNFENKIRKKKTRAYICPIGSCRVNVTLTF